MKLLTLKIFFHFRLKIRTFIGLILLFYKLMKLTIFINIKYPDLLNLNTNLKNPLY